MIKVKKEEIISLLKLKPSGHKGWFGNGDCPFCGKEKHLGVIFGSIPSFKCQRCQTKGFLGNLLYKVGRPDLMRKEIALPQINSLIEGSLNTFTLDYSDISEEDLFCETKSTPIGYKRKKSIPYLDLRGFTPIHYEKYNIGESFLDPRLKNYVIFIITEGGESKGWIARSTLSKIEIDEINKKRKDKGVEKILRWRNQTNIPFDKLLFGFDEITENTTTIILVESITSKSNVDLKLNLFSEETTKCLVSFGKSLSKYQIKKILNKNNIKNIILMYDPDALREIKQYSIELEKYFNVDTAYLPFGDKDPGDLEGEEFEFIFENELYSPIEFNLNKLELKELK